MARTVKIIAVCLPPEIQADGKIAAKEDARSFSNYIAHLIRQDLKRRQAQSQAV